MFPIYRGKIQIKSEISFFSAKKMLVHKRDGLLSVASLDGSEHAKVSVRNWRLFYILWFFENQKSNQSLTFWLDFRTIKQSIKQNQIL